MSGEIKLFRRELFGGFARRDVIEYIRRLAGERNKHSSAQKAAEEEIVKLSAAIDELRAELDASNLLVRQVRVTALTDAQHTLGELGSAYDDVRTDIEATANHIRSELLKAADTVSLLTQILQRAGNRFGELSGIVATEKADADEELRAMIPPEPEPEIYQNPEVVLQQLKIPPRGPREDSAVESNADGEPGN